MKASYLGFDSLFIARYVLEHPGDEVKRHTHAPNDPGHVTIILTGKLKIHGPDFSHELNAGEIYDFPKNESTHALTALEPNTIILNVRKENATELINEMILGYLSSGT